jgi:hypothetical protein
MGGTPSAGGATTVDGGPGVGGTTNVVDAPGAGGAAEVGGATSTGGTVSTDGAPDESPDVGGSVATDGPTKLPVTCALPSTLGSCPAGSISCGPVVCCRSSYPNYCSQTDKCYATQAAAVAACGSTPCVACVAATCQCNCECQSSDYPPIDFTWSTCQAAQAGLQGCTECCEGSCSARSLYYDRSGLSCTALP